MYTLLINAGEYAVGIFATREEAENYLNQKYPYQLKHHTIIEIKEKSKNDKATK